MSHDLPAEFSRVQTGCCPVFHLQLLTRSFILMAQVASIWYKTVPRDLVVTLKLSIPTQFRRKSTAGVIQW